jgi:UDP-N-acetylmuramate-alanine ligase
MSSLRILTGVFLTVAAAVAAPGTAVPERPVPAKAAAKPSAQPRKSDTEIEKDLRTRLANSKISQDKFQVHVQGGVATIEGKTDVVQHKGVATRMAKNAGAVAVANKIQISDAAREKAAQNLETGRRRAQIKRGEARSETSATRTGR